jgi:hypothetical protein
VRPTYNRRGTVKRAWTNEGSVIRYMGRRFAVVDEAISDRANVEIARVRADFLEHVFTRMFTLEATIRLWHDHALCTPPSGTAWDSILDKQDDVTEKVIPDAEHTGDDSDATD